MRAVLLIVFLCTALFAHAETGAGAFGAMVDKGHAGKDYPAAGMTFDIATEGPAQIGANAFFFANGLGTALTLGTRVDNWRFVAGAGVYDDEIKDLVTVAGVDVTAKDSAQGNVYFVEASYKKFFARVSQVDTDFSILGSRQTGTTLGGDPIYSYATKNVSTRDRWLWVGMRFSI